MARIGITGATGLVGTRLADVVRRAGHSVVHYTRDPKRLAARLPAGDEARPWPLSGPDDVRVDALVNLVGESVAGRWSAAKKAAILASRVDGTRALVDQIAALPPESRPKVLVSASAIGFYGETGARRITEDSPAGTDFLADVCVKWEAEAERASALGVRVVRLRIGLVMAAGGGALLPMLPLFKLGLGGALGSGDQYWAWVHIDDVVGLIRHAIEHDDVRGALNATAPEPVTQRAFARELASALHRPAFLPAPAFALRTVLGEFSAEVLGSHRVVPERTLASGYRFAFDDLGACLRDVTR